MFFWKRCWDEISYPEQDIDSVRDIFIKIALTQPHIALESLQYSIGFYGYCYNIYIKVILLVIRYL